MSGLLHHFALTAKTRTGFSVGIVVWAIVAAISIAATIIFFSIAGFVVIAQRYDTMIAGLALFGRLANRNLSILSITDVFLMRWPRSKSDTSVERGRQQGLSIFTDIAVYKGYLFGDAFTSRRIQNNWRFPRNTGLAFRPADCRISRQMGISWLQDRLQRVGQMNYAPTT
jgi:hypothetical protein